MRIIVATLFTAILFVASSGATLADDWEAIRLRGTVLELVDGEWVKLKRGSIVPDSRVIRTMRTGNVEFRRGNEHITIGPETQVQIYDKGGDKPFTTVKQYFGTVSVEAEVRQVEHFAVQTDFLAAVVKGTKFVVTSDEAGAKVEVKRGHVYVEDNSNQSNVTLSVGQHASLSPGSVLDVNGRGTLPPVLDRKGAPLAAATSAQNAAAVSAAQAALVKALADGDRKAIKAAEKALKEAEKAVDKSNSSHGTGKGPKSDRHEAQSPKGPKGDKPSKDDKPAKGAPGDQSKHGSSDSGNSGNSKSDKGNGSSSEGGISSGSGHGGGHDSGGGSDSHRSDGDKGHGGGNDSGGGSGGGDKKEKKDK